MVSNAANFVFGFKSLFGKQIDDPEIERHQHYSGAMLIENQKG